MKRLDLPVEQPILLDARVAVHGPHKAERVPSAATAAAGVRVLVRLGAEDGGRRPSVNLDVSSADKAINCEIVSALSHINLHIRPMATHKDNFNPRLTPGLNVNEAVCFPFLPSFSSFRSQNQSNRPNLRHSFPAAAPPFPFPSSGPSLPIRQNDALRPS